MRIRREIAFVAILEVPAEETKIPSVPMRKRDGVARTGSGKAEKSAVIDAIEVTDHPDLAELIRLPGRTKIPRRLDLSDALWNPTSRPK